MVEAVSKSSETNYLDVSKQMSTLAYDTVALTEFWEVALDLLMKIPCVRDQFEQAWADSVHQLHPNYSEEYPNLSAHGPPKFFTDNMKQNVSVIAAQNYQRTLEHFRRERFPEVEAPRFQQAVMNALCYSSHRNAITGDGAERCHSALYEAVEEALRQLPNDKPGQIHLGIPSVRRKEHRDPISSDFLAAFCPQLNRAPITHLHVHGPLKTREDRELLFRTLETCYQIRSLNFDLDRENAAKCLPLLITLLEANPHFQNITITNYGEDKKDIEKKDEEIRVDEGTWQNLNDVMLTCFSLESIRFKGFPHPPLGHEPDRAYFDS